ncbi:DUF6196 family protein [Duganella sp. Dugasp56]|uniref:DUF6196 family protein n=1 Tax=Duganella sp. Dugasp56 TaxID=3243046 RepID=UPI00159E9313
MYISHETAQQTSERLQGVISAAELSFLPAPYAFMETSVADFPVELLGTALAFVRDEQVWSALVPATSPDQEQFMVFSFHFTPGLDNSGFVGWLASHLKTVLGTGVLVVCGQNAQRGGIFDYWGVPLAMASQTRAELDRLRRLR